MLFYNTERTLEGRNDKANIRNKWEWGYTALAVSLLLFVSLCAIHTDAHTYMCLAVFVCVCVFANIERKD